MLVALTDAQALWLRGVIKDYKRKCPMGKSSTHCPSSGGEEMGGRTCTGAGCIVGNESITRRDVVFGVREGEARTEGPFRSQWEPLCLRLCPCEGA